MGYHENLYTASRMRSKSPQHKRTVETDLGSVGFGPRKHAQALVDTETKLLSSSPAQSPGLVVGASHHRVCESKDFTTSACLISARPLTMKTWC